MAYADISEETKSRLPKVLVVEGNLLILSGEEMTGFAGIYERFDRVEGDTADDTAWTLFWASSVVGEEGEKLLERAGGDHKMVREYMARGFIEKRYDPAGLPAVILTDGVKTMRMTNMLTSSVKPDRDWRADEASLSRIILLGDAIHPMTPGRGMGANQTLLDAENLSRLMVEGGGAESRNDEAHWQRMVQTFDAEMYGRAFKMVKASENMTSLDLNRVRDRFFTSCIGLALIVGNWLTSVLQMFGLYKPPVWA